MVFSIRSLSVGQWHSLERWKSKYICKDPCVEKDLEKNKIFIIEKFDFPSSKFTDYGRKLYQFPSQISEFWAWQIKFLNDKNVVVFPNIFRRKGTCLYFDFRRSRECHRPTDKLHIEKTIKIVNYHLFFGTGFISRTTYACGAHHAPAGMVLVYHTMKWRGPLKCRRLQRS